MHTEYAVKSVLDTDFYKLLMLQLIWKKYRNVEVTFRVKNRTKDVDLNKVIDRKQLEKEMRWVTNLKFENEHIRYLRNLKSAEGNAIFAEDFLQYLQNEYYLQPNFDVSESVDLNNDLVFKGTWDSVTMWEIYILPILNSLRNRKLFESFNDDEFYAAYYFAQRKFDEKGAALYRNKVKGISDFGTRRRDSFEHQRNIIRLAIHYLGSGFSGTSNVHLARQFNLIPIGTNAHEIPMVLAALTDNDEDLKQSQYQVLEDWMQLYDKSMWTVLPDTFGTRQFLKDAPVELMKQISGIRIDSMDNAEAANLLIDYWNSIGIDPKTKIAIFSDGLDCDEIIKINNAFGNRLMCRYGWGTTLTNDFIDCVPSHYDANYLKPISLVCKVNEVNGRSAVKLSDNISKATGSPEEIERYKRVFGSVNYEKETLV